VAIASRLPRMGFWQATWPVASARRPRAARRSELSVELARGSHRAAAGPRWCPWRRGKGDGPRRSWAGRRRWVRQPRSGRLLFDGGSAQDSGTDPTRRTTPPPPPPLVSMGFPHAYVAAGAPLLKDSTRRKEPSPRSARASGPKRQAGWEKRTRRRWQKGTQGRGPQERGPQERWWRSLHERGRLGFGIGG
jgi:hypothetical protein